MSEPVPHIPSTPIFDSSSRHRQSAGASLGLATNGLNCGSLIGFSLHTAHVGGPSDRGICCRTTLR
ncbi:MAG: hypothetical protein AAFO75_00120, partial [Pseudomonadota bacterium]